MTRLSAELRVKAIKFSLLVFSKISCQNKSPICELWGYRRPCHSFGRRISFTHSRERNGLAPVRAAVTYRELSESNSRHSWRKKQPIGALLVPIQHAAASATGTAKILGN